MRTLSIIPACEGSIILPNKNMRIIHGKPMIYYVISNAKNCSYIDDIIVTSNSNEILALARQMHVMTLKRDKKLCSSNVSLDAVIWDVFKQIDINQYDYVVTMQSISPTLRVNTLNKAFEQMIEQGYDSMISVKNQAQFYWSRNSHNYIPLHKVRMNRHMLPPFYMETGAFLISKSSCISPDSRLGNNVGLFELFGDEAIDIYTFGDLVQVENAMRHQSTAIYVNGNSEIGMGHISRSIQIADELFAKPDIYYNRSITSRKSFGSTAYNLIPVNSNRDFINKLKNKKYDIIINDILNTSVNYMKELKDASPNSRIVNLEDEGDGVKYADIVINALYESSYNDNVISGHQYFIIPKLFLIYNPIPIRENVTTVLVTFGGADPQNYTGALLRIAANQQYKSIKFYVILGRANNNVKNFDSLDKSENIVILYDIDNMPEIMYQCDVAVSSRGRTCFELAALGIPTLSIAQHGREENHTFVCEENGFICLPTNSDMDHIEHSFNSLIKSDYKKRKQLQERMLKNDLRNGRINIAKILND